MSMRRTVIATQQPQRTIEIGHVRGVGIDLALTQEAAPTIFTRLTPWEALQVASVLVEAALAEADRAEEALTAAERALRQAEADPQVIAALGERVAVLEGQATEALVILASAHTHAKVVNNRDCMGPIERAMLRLRRPT